MRTFSSDNDVWDVIDLIIKETDEANSKGGSFNTAESVMAQLPFFACNNIILSKDSQKDIARFIYSKDFGISPYQGSYGDQPSKWIEKSFLLKNLLERQKAKAQSNG
jgi:hypothetical protein